MSNTITYKKTRSTAQPDSADYFNPLPQARTRKFPVGLQCVHLCLFERNTTRKEASLIPFIIEKFHYASQTQNQNDFFRLQNLHAIEATGNVKDTSNKSLTHMG